MKRISAILLAGVAAFAINATVAGLVPLAAAETTTMVGGAPMYPSKNIVQNAVNSKVHTTLVAAVKAAGLVQTLESPGPFTVFAPTNDAFAKLPDGTVATLLKPENKQTLTNVLTYHVVPGRFTTKDLRDRIKAGSGKAELKTVQGGTLTIISITGSQSVSLIDTFLHLLQQPLRLSLRQRHRTFELRTPPV
jgi:uncharacterized surface protein with fasciclin (FAS1) repeats